MNPAPDALVQARRKDTEVRKQRVLNAAERLSREGEELTVSSVARQARVHRSFIHRHPDLHAAVQAKAAATVERPDGTTISRASLKAELATATERCRRQAERITQLERRLSEELGAELWRQTGLGPPPDMDALQRQNTHLEQQVIRLRQQLADREDDLDAARSANRELMTRLNRTQPS